MTLNENGPEPKAKRCPCTNPHCPGSGGGFYVVATRGKRQALIAGPFETHSEALDVLPRAWMLAWYDNPMHSAKWRIGHLSEGPYTPGQWNEQLGITAALP